MIIKPGDFNHPAVKDLLKTHLSGMHENSPPDSVYALDYSELQQPNILFLTAWEEQSLLGCGALQELTAHHGEIKSMRTYQQHLRKGVAAKLLERILEVAADRQYTTISLETGSGPAFDPAIALYKKYGFESGGAFGGYEKSAFNQFMHLRISR